MAKGNDCYYCGLPLTGGKSGNKKVEHVPPKMLFRAFECDSITVPACPAHNTDRSKQDQALISGFMKSLDEGKYTLAANVQTAINYEKTKSTFERTKNTAQPKAIFRRPRGKLKRFSKLAYITFPTDDWICQITAGLIFDAIHKHDPAINWQDAVIHHPNWYPGNSKGFTKTKVIELTKKKQEMTEIWETQLNWLNGWSADPRPYPPDIYRFYVAFEKPIFFKHVFYNSFVWYIGFECSEATHKSLENKVLEINR